VDVLKRLRADEAKRLLAVGLRIGPKSWVFSDRLGTDPWRPDRPTQRWVRLRKVTPELAGVRLHDLRHLVATELLAAGVDLAVVAGRLGHSSPRTTLGVYGHALPGREREAADIIAARLG
jgi:integrase